MVTWLTTLKRQIYQPTFENRYFLLLYKQQWSNNGNDCMLTWVKNRRHLDNSHVFLPSWCQGTELNWVDELLLHQSTALDHCGPKELCWNEMRNCMSRYGNENNSSVRFRCCSWFCFLFFNLVANLYFFFYRRFLFIYFKKIYKPKYLYFECEYFCHLWK